jgi:hypothetical protein
MFHERAPRKRITTAELMAALASRRTQTVKCPFPLNGRPLPLTFPSRLPKNNGDQNNCCPSARLDPRTDDCKTLARPCKPGQI